LLKLNQISISYSIDKKLVRNYRKIKLRLIRSRSKNFTKQAVHPISIAPQKNHHHTHRLIGAFWFVVDLINASLIGPDKRKCDENNNSNSNKPAATDNEEAKTSSQNDESSEKVEKIKPKQMVGLFPLDLRSELKSRVGGKVGFSLKKSSTNVDIFEKKKTQSDPIPIKLPKIKSNRPSDLLKSIQESQMRRKVQDDSDEDEGGQEKLSFKEKLQLIERSSSKSLVNPL
jgi:hypothetical protein